MADVQPQEIEQLKRMLVDYHAQHARERGPIPTCKDATCVETKLGLQYLAQNSSSPIDLREFENR